MNPFSVDIGAIVADVDMTIIADGHSELSGENLDALAGALKRGIPVILISGSPYEDSYLGVSTSGSLRRRVTRPLQRALAASIQNMRHLQIFYVSGRGTVRFDDSGAEIRPVDRTDKDIDAALQSHIFRAFLGAFYEVQLSSKQVDADTFEKIWSVSSDADAASFARDRLQQNLGQDVGALEKWAFGSEIALVFHGVRSAGPEIAKRAQARLIEKRILLPTDLFWAGGVDYAKASRIRKRDVIERALAALGADRDMSGKTVLMFGDSHVDDFLALGDETHLPIFLGSKSDAANFPSTWLAVDDQRHDRLQARAFGPVLKNLLERQPIAAPFSLVKH
jgi:hydroxymethylpyrimidine pyrophosphatase-like HAD family hydrolase